MNNKQENKRSLIGHAGIALFGNIRVMAVAALLTALSIVLGKYLAVNVTDSLRISFENLPILMAGLFFGPLIGGVVGAAAEGYLIMLLFRNRNFSGLLSRIINKS